jgi:hypothetical protein
LSWLAHVELSVTAMSENSERAVLEVDQYESEGGKPKDNNGQESIEEQVYSEEEQEYGSDESDQDTNDRVQDAEEDQGELSRIFFTTCTCTI